MATPTRAYFEDLIFELVLKAMGRHVKYIRRTGTPGNYRYYYAKKPGKGRNKGATEDEGVSHRKLLGDKHEAFHKDAVLADGKGNHFYINEVDGKDIRLTLKTKDGTDHQMKLTTDQLRDVLKEGHAEAFKKHAEIGLNRRKELLESAKKIGSAKHIQRAEAEVERWRNEHKDYLPQGEKYRPHVQAQREMFGAAREHGLEKEHLRDLLGVSSLSEDAKEATPEAMRELAGKLKSSTPKQVADMVKAAREAKQPKQEPTPQPEPQTPVEERKEAPKAGLNRRKKDLKDAIDAKDIDRAQEILKDLRDWRTQHGLTYAKTDAEKKNYGEIDEMSKRLDKMEQRREERQEREAKEAEFRKHETSLKQHMWDLDHMYEQGDTHNNPSPERLKKEKQAIDSLWAAHAVGKEDGDRSLSLAVRPYRPISAQAFNERITEIGKKIEKAKGRNRDDLISQGRFFEAQRNINAVTARRLDAEKASAKQAEQQLSRRESPHSMAVAVEAGSALDMMAIMKEQALSKASSVEEAERLRDEIAKLDYMRKNLSLDDGETAATILQRIRPNSPILAKHERSVREGHEAAADLIRRVDPNSPALAKYEQSKREAGTQAVATRGGGAR